MRLYALQTPQQRAAYQKRFAGCVGNRVLETLEGRAVDKDKKQQSIIDEIETALLIFCGVACAVGLVAACVLFSVRF